jgi:hypothetical protein
MGRLFPMTYVLPVSVGTLTKGLRFSDLAAKLGALTVFIPVRRNLRAQLAFLPWREGSPTQQSHIMPISYQRAAQDPQRTLGHISQADLVNRGRRTQESFSYAVGDNTLRHCRLRDRMRLDRFQ